MTHTRRTRFEEKGRAEGTFCQPRVPTQDWKKQEPPSSPGLRELGLADTLSFELLAYANNALSTKASVWFLVLSLQNAKSCGLAVV